MSKSNASAKNRRAYGGNPPPSSSGPVPVPSSGPLPGPSSGPNQQGQGFTLQQVIAVIDSRLLNLEKFVNESKEGPPRRVQFEDTLPQQNLVSQSSDNDSVQEILNEFSSRFDMIVEEVTTLKDIVLKLQSYTMDVNKTLMEERINILSDLGTNNQMFNISNEAAVVGVDANDAAPENVTSELMLDA